ncbi:MAG TPA: hypothetical protein VM347_26630 [Nonomuraea sp.]|nr:hypothetical protein [Nonomuraea sp.]
MTGSQIVPVITDAPPPRPRPAAERWRYRARAALAVFVLVATALDAWLTAQLGIAPIWPTVRYSCSRLIAECRAWAVRAVDAEIVDDSDRKVRL